MQGNSAPTEKHKAIFSLIALLGKFQLAGLKKESMFAMSGVERKYPKLAIPLLIVSLHIEYLRPCSWAESDSIFKDSIGMGSQAW